MVRPTLLLLILPTFVASVLSSGNSSAIPICQEIDSKVSSASDVIYALHPRYASDIHHWFHSSSQTPACVFEPGSVDDLATAVQIIGSSRTPFAVRSGGHASNPGFSSTTGVHISLGRMDQVVLSADNSTVEIGMGNTWVDVYKKLEGTGYNVVGGRAVGPGVGGFTLGGGFSWKTNQYGLTCDTVKSFTLVLPNGTITQVDSDKPDLFFALKGGLNRFGIVTSAEFHTHEQSPQVYGGFVIYGNDDIDDVLEATARFDAGNTDPKAQIITTLSGSTLGGTTALVLFFYDGPSRPESFGPFDNIAAILDATSTRTFADLVQSFPSDLVINVRGTFHTISTSRLTPGFVAAVKNETDTLGKAMASHGGTMISYDIEPFLRTFGEMATDSAYPHANSPLPLNLYFAWLSPADDEFWYEAMRTSVETLRSVAIEEGIYPSDSTAYPNYAITNTTAEDLYGARNAERLRSIRSQVDPDGVMGLAGGFFI